MIVKTTDDLIALVNANFPSGLLKKVDKLPGQLNDAILTRFLVQQPAVYFAFIGGRGKGDTNSARINASWGCYVITDVQQNQHSVSVDQILDALVPLIHGHTIKGVGTFTCTAINNLFSKKFDEKGAQVHAITFTLPNLSFDYTPDMSALSNFVTYHAEHSLAEGSDEPEAIDHITLEQ